MAYLRNVTLAHQAKSVEGQAFCAGHYFRPEVKAGCKNPPLSECAYCLECYDYMLGEAKREFSDAELAERAEVNSRKFVSTDFLYRISRYGLTEAEYDAILVRQGGCCAICKVKRGKYEYHIDHDHKCCEGFAKSCGGCVRGLLCRECNLSLGHLEKPRFLVSALHYLNGKGTSEHVTI